MSPAIALRKALAHELRSRVDSHVEECYAIFDRATDLAEGKWYVAINADGVKEYRAVDLRDIVIDIGYQIALPEATKANPKPLANIAFLDGCMERFEAVRALFAEGGKFRDSSIANCIVIEVLETPPYIPANLIDHGLFTTLLRIRFRLETT